MRKFCKRRRVQRTGATLVLTNFFETEQLRSASRDALSLRLSANTYVVPGAKTARGNRCLGSPNNARRRRACLRSNAEMTDLVTDLRSVLDIVSENIASTPYLVRVVGLCLVCATIADDIRDKYLLHFWVSFPNCTELDFLPQEATGCCSRGCMLLLMCPRSELCCVAAHLCACIHLTATEADASTSSPCCAALSLHGGYSAIATQKAQDMAATVCR